MGDNRANSADSRYHLNDKYNGTVPEELVVGRAFVVAWPTSHWRSLDEPETYASVPDRAETVKAAPKAGNPGESRLHPIPVELPIVMSVAGMLPRWVAAGLRYRARVRARSG